MYSQISRLECEVAGCQERLAKLSTRRTVDISALVDQASRAGWIADWTYDTHRRRAVVLLAICPKHAEKE